MNLLALPHKVVNLENGNVNLCIELPSSDVVALVLALTSMTELARSLAYQTKIATVTSRAHINGRRASDFWGQFITHVNLVFDECMQKGMTAKDAISYINLKSKLLYPNTTYDIVKKILTDSGQLRNKGYNCKKKLDT